MSNFMKDIVHVVFQIAGHESWSEPRTGLVVGCDSLLPRTQLSSFTRHIKVADFYVRELVARNIVTVSHVPSGEMLADVLTKALASPKFGIMVSYLVSRL